MASIFEKITGKIDEGIKVVSSKSKEFIETAKLKGEIKDVQSSVENRFQSLGKKVFEMINRGSLNEDEIRAECKEISLLFKKITEIEEDIKQSEIKALKTRYGADAIMCSKCSSPNKSDARFCMSCGSAMAIEAIAEGNNCPSCNAHVQEGAKFCMRCGGKID